MPKWGNRLLALSLTVILCACTSGDGSVHGESMSADQFIQHDINRVITLAMRDNLDSLTVLLAKLYKRNPRYWRIAGFANYDEAFAAGKKLIQTGTVPDELRGLRDIEVLSVAMDPNYPGDRVSAFILGLANMIIAAHGDKTRFYISDIVDAQNVFNAARNVEIADWLLTSRRDANNDLLLLSNSIGEQSVNLSFERELGAIIGRLDLIAAMQDESLRRIGINYLQGMLFFNFLPVR